MPAPTYSSDPSPSCTNCGATNSTTYSGTGVGVWNKPNTGTAPVDFKVDIGGLVSKDVTLIFTNETNADVAMSSVPLSSQMVAQPARPSLLSSVAANMQPRLAANEAVTEFNRTGFRQHLRSQKVRSSTYAVNSSVTPAQYAVGNTRAFNYHDGSSRTTILKKQVLLSDGVQLNLWVESSEASEAKVSTSLVDQLSSAFSRTGGIYDLLKDTGGPLWGPHNYAELLPAGQPIDIVVLNFVPDGQPFGELGYFHAVNSFKKTSMSESNESVSLYLDAESLYLGGAKGVQAIKGTLAHEGMHMSNFYRRGVKMAPDYQFDTWLEEMSAMIMEDAASNAVDVNYNSTRDLRYPQYLSYATYNCPLLDFTGFGSTCESYSVTGSIGGFLLRQMGMAFYKNLLNQNNTISEMALDSAIKAFRPQSSLGIEVRKFAAGAITALPSSSAPAGFNFPARTDGLYTIPVINAVSYKPYRVMPTSVPSTLKGYASFPVLRKSVTGRFTETVRVPAGVTLSVIIN